MPQGLPEDFAVFYEYFGAALAPPYPYAYAISADRACSGEISFSPDCYSPDHPTWHMEFGVDLEALRILYKSMLENGVFRPTWETLEDPPEGANSQQMTVTACDRTYHVPMWVEDVDAVAGIYEAITSLVPSALWDTLMVWRDNYIAAYPGGS